MKQLSIIKHFAGKKMTWVSKTVLVEREDANEFVEGSNVTFINWGNIMITRVVRDENNQVSLIKVDDVLFFRYKINRTH